MCIGVIADVGNKTKDTKKKQCTGTVIQNNAINGSIYKCTSVVWGFISTKMTRHRQSKTMAIKILSVC